MRGRTSIRSDLTCCRNDNLVFQMTMNTGFYSRLDVFFCFRHMSNIKNRSSVITLYLKVGWCLTALSALGGYIVPWEFETCYVGPEDKTNIQVNEKAPRETQTLRARWL